MIDEEIHKALNVDPSPEFVARVRMRVAREPAPSAWRWAWTLAAAGAMAAAIAIAVVVSRPWGPRDAAQVFPPAHAADLVLRARSAPTVQERVAQAPRPAHAGLKPRATRAAEAFARQRSASAAEPEILIDPREGFALRRLLAGVRAGRVDLAAVANASAPAIMELPAIQAIEIPAITIDPITPSGEQGARQ